MKLALGTVQFGLNYGVANQRGQVTLDEARSILHHASLHGINMLDTAIGYGDSEQRLGEIGVENWHVVSKLPAVPDGCRDISRWVINSVKGTLERTKIRKLYGLLLHRPHQLLDRNGIGLYNALEQLKHDGIVQKIGVSIYDPAELDGLLSRYCFDIVQSPFSILDRRLITASWLSRLADQHIEVHVRSIFLQGLLLMAPGERPKKFERWSSVWTRWHEWLKEAGLTALQACICFALSFPEINKVVIGVDNQNQLKQILNAAVGPVPEVPSELQSLDLDLINPSNWAGF